MEGTARATEGHTTLPVPHEVLEVIVDVSREIFHFNILTSASICRHDSLLNVHSVASQI